MIKIEQTEHELIGSKDDIEALSKKESARILCISDSHGNIKLYEKLISRYGKDCDALIFCGDGFRDLIQLLYMADENPEFKEIFPAVVAFVQGNNDSSSCYITPDFLLKAPKNQILNACGKNIYISHGHREGVVFGFENLGFEAQLSDAKIILYGHTHVPSNQTIGDYRFINPGSITFPRGYQHYPSFAILTIQGRNIDTAFIEILDSRDEKFTAKIFSPFC